MSVIPFPSQRCDAYQLAAAKVYDLAHFITGISYTNGPERFSFGCTGIRVTFMRKGETGVALQVRVQSLLVLPFESVYSIDSCGQWRQLVEAYNDDRRQSIALREHALTPALALLNELLCDTPCQHTNVTHLKERRAS